METALIYAYKVKDAEKWEIDPQEISLAYQVDQLLNPHQCDFGKDMTSQMLRKFKDDGGLIRTISSEEELILPLSEHKILVPIPPKLLQEWGLSSLISPTAH